MYLYVFVFLMPFLRLYFLTYFPYILSISLHVILTCLWYIISIMYIMYWIYMYIYLYSGFLFMLQFTALHQSSAAVKILSLLESSAQDWLTIRFCYILEDRHSRATRQSVSVLILIFLKITFCVSLRLYVFVFLMPSLHFYFLRTFHIYSLFLGL